MYADRMLLDVVFLLDVRYWCYWMLFLDVIYYWMLLDASLTTVHMPRSAQALPASR